VQTETSGRSCPFRVPVTYAKPIPGFQAHPSPPLLLIYTNLTAGTPYDAESVCNSATSF
jgi:hypothetical protein